MRTHSRRLAGHPFPVLLEDGREVERVHWGGRAPVTLSCSHSKLVCIPGLVIRGVNDGVEGRDDPTGGLDVVGTATIATGVATEMACGSGCLIFLLHLAVVRNSSSCWPPRGGERGRLGSCRGQFVSSSRYGRKVLCQL